jgi:AcrR family transcriptional regulator
MKTRKRLTRQESKDVTRARLVEAAEQLFIRKGFDDTSVEEISETAGYSRGAFYSNFDDKDQVFLAVINRHRGGALEVIDDTFQQISECEGQIVAVREWLSNQWRRKDFVVLQMEFSRRAMKDRSVRKHVSELWQEEIELIDATVCRFIGMMGELSPDRPQITGLVLLAVAHGLGILALDTGPEWEQMYTEAAKLAFDRLTASHNSQNLTS